MIFISHKSSLVASGVDVYRQLFLENIKSARIELIEVPHNIIESDFTGIRIKERPKILERFILSLLYDAYIAIIIILNREKQEKIIISSGKFNRYWLIYILFSNVVYIHHTYPKEPSWLSLRLYGRLIRVRTSNTIVTVSEFAKKQMCSVYGPIEVSVIENFLPDIADYVERKTKRSRNSVKTILNVGAVIAYKNPDVWLSVAKYVTKIVNSHVEFVWVGDGPLLKEFRNKSVDYENIHFIGHKVNVTEYYELAHIYFQPSRVENYSLSIIDANRNGLPAVVSSVGGNCEATCRLSSYIADANDEKSFASAIINLLENAGERDAKGQSARLFYEKENTIKVAKKKFSRLGIY